MIISKTPLRMSFVGGGSDMQSYYKESHGAVLSTSINRYIYIALNNKFDNKIRLSYSKTEEVGLVSQIEHILYRECLKYVGIENSIEIASLADIPSQGSGLGSSSSFTVGLLNALYKFKGVNASKKLLAEIACKIEIDICGDPIGKQDQYAAAYGDMNLITFLPDETVTVEKVQSNPATLKQLNENILVFFTGRTRSASQILASQSSSLLQKDKRALMNRMVELVYEMRNELEKNQLDNIGEILNENWVLKAQLTSGITDSQINDWYSIGLKNGAHGGKLLGAGNGGFLMFFAPQHKHSDIINALEDLEVIDVKFDNKGSVIKKI